jgi:hypothetical protein
MLQTLDDTIRRLPLMVERDDNRDVSGRYSDGEYCLYIASVCVGKKRKLELVPGPMENK